VPSKGDHRTLRRCTSGGIIGVPLLGERPLFKVAKTRSVAG
jgi:hypothetical protein